MANQPQNIGQAGLALIKSFEGRRLDKYRDAAGNWSIGYGHLFLPHEKIPETLNQEKIDELLLVDLRAAERGIHKLVDVDLNQNQFDALVAFTFNIGVGNLRHSTLLCLLNQGHYLAAADQLLRWNKAGGDVLAGLERRRDAERTLFLTPMECH